MTDQWKTRGGEVGNAVRRGAEATANGIHRVASFVARNDNKVADSAQGVTKLAGAAIDRSGQAISQVGRQTSSAIHSNATRNANAVRDSIAGSGEASALRKGAGGLGWLATKLVTHAGGLTADAVSLIGKATAATGRFTENSAPVVGGTLGGVVRGGVEIASNAIDATALSASSIDAMRQRLRSLGRGQLERGEANLRAIQSAQDRRRKDELLDLLVVGGVTLGQALRDPASVPADVERAFELAYPGLSQTESFAEAVDRMSSDELAGLVSGVKGKLFELDLVDHLNHGGLPDGFHASLAHSATQPGWDIQILDGQGQVSELLQAKATESVGYVKDAIERYPDIDVTTTTEVHAQLVALGLAQDVHNSGISEVMLQAKVDAATHAGSAFDASDLVPSSIGLAVIALSVFMNQDSNMREKGAAFGTRSAKAGVSTAVGKMAMLATQTWWVGLIAGVGSNWLAGRGRVKREQYEALKSALTVMTERQRLQSTNHSLLSFEG